MYSFLLVDDEPILRQGLRIMLENSDIPIKKIADASNGDAAFELICHERFDFILSDIKMPQCNGIKLSEKIYKFDQSIKIVIISGYNDFEYAKNAMQFGVKDYILKPVNSHILISSLKRIISEVSVNRTYVSLERINSIIDVLANNIFAFNGDDGKNMFFSTLQELHNEQCCLFYNDITSNLKKYISDKMDAELTSCAEEVLSSSDKQTIMLLFTNFISALSEEVYNRQNNIHFDIIKVTKEYINDNYNKDLSLDALASFVHVNPSYLSHIFKLKTNNSITGYRNFLRINKAAELLTFSAKSVSEITFEIGYNDVNYFIKTFKKSTGLTPLEYRKQRKDKNNAK